VVAERLEKQGFKRLSMCSCMYIKRVGDKICIIYDFVDDFIFTGNCTEFTNSQILEMRAETSTTEPVWNAERVLGMQWRIDRVRKVICITMLCVGLGCLKCGQ
jgi:hypothetical protein